MIGGANRVLRGGSFGITQWFVKCATRFMGYPSDRTNYIGFRVATPDF